MISEHTKPLTVFLTAGEASGDILGARLMRSLKEQYKGPVLFSGVGGSEMEREGLQSLFPMSDLSLMGIVEILPRLPLVLKRIQQTADAIISRNPDVVVTIDAPDFSFRVAESVQKRVKRTAKWIHCVAPTVWAWRPERAKKVARLYDGLICLLPFEPDYFIREGMSAAFTGHPMLEKTAGLEQGARFRKKHGIPDDAFVLGVLCGSRRGEMARTAEVLRDAVALAAQEALNGSQLHIIAPTLPHLRQDVTALLKDLPYTVHIGTTDKWESFAAMDAAMAVSGTVALELAVSGVPHLIGYRMNPLTWSAVRRKVKVKYAHLANILLDDEVVPEFIQDRCTPEAMAKELAPLFSRNGAAATAQRTSFLSLRDKLAGNGLEKPAVQAASYVLGLYAQDLIESRDQS